LHGHGLLLCWGIHAAVQARDVVASPDVLACVIDTR
jgi:hypothetical protein